MESKPDGLTWKTGEEKEVEAALSYIKLVHPQVSQLD
jgi:hypothetical protein